MTQSNDKKKLSREKRLYRENQKKVLKKSFENGKNWKKCSSRNTPEMSPLCSPTLKGPPPFSKGGGTSKAEA